MLAASGFSATRTWTGGGTDDNWTTADNWGGVAPVAGDDLVFAGSTRLAPNNDFAALTSFASISFNAGAGDFVLGGNSLTLSGGASAIACNATSGTMTINNALTYATAAPTLTTASGGTLVVSGTQDNGGLLLTVSGAGNTAMNGLISGAGGLTKSGTGTLTLSAANSYGGTTTISAGTLRLGAAGVIPDASALMVNGTFDLGGYSETVGDITGAGVIDNTIGSGTYTLTFGNAAGSYTYSGVIQNGSGTLALTKTGTGFVTLSGNNTYSGTTLISNGIIIPDHANALGATSVGTVVNSGKALVLRAHTYAAEPITINGSGWDATLGALRITTSSVGTAIWTGPVTLGSASTIGTGAATNQLNLTGGISGSTTLTSVTGPVVISGTSSHSGGTTVSSGSVYQNGTASSTAVTVNSGATFGGTGTAAAITASSGTVMPGSSSAKGVLTAASADFSGGTSSSLTIRASGTTTAGTDYDRLVLSGALTLGGSSVLNLNLNGMSGSGILSGIVQAGSISGTFATFNVTNNSGGNTVTLVYNATSIDVKIEPTVSSLIPTPGGIQKSTSGFSLGINFGSQMQVGTGNVVLKKTSDNSVIETISISSSTVSQRTDSTIKDFETSNQWDDATAGTTYSQSNFVSRGGGNSERVITTADYQSAGFNNSSNPIFSGYDSLVAYVFSVSSGKQAALYSLSNTDWVWVDAGQVNLTAGAWTRISMPISRFSNSSLVRRLGVLFASPGTYYVDDMSLVRSSNKSFRIPVTATLLPGTSYYVNVDAGAIKDMADQPYAGIANNSTWAFTTLNNTPQDIALSASIIAEFQATGTTVGTLSTTDPDAGETFTYTLVAGTGSTDNASFTISGASLLSAAVFNYPTKNSYSVRIRSTDVNGAYTDKEFTISITSLAGQTYTWTGATSADWGTATNWSPTGIPGQAANIVVDKAGGASIQLNGNRSVTNITLGNNGTDVMTIAQGSSGSLTLASGGSISTHASSTGAQVISAPLVLASSPTITVANASGSVEISGVVSGSYGLTKAGSGKLTLAGANTFTGGVSLSAGTLNINHATALGTSAGTFTIAGGTTIDNTSGGSLTLTANQPQTWNGNFTFTGTNALNLGAGAVAMGAALRVVTVSASTLTVGGAISGTGGLTKDGAGTMALGSVTAEYWTGTTTLSGGTLLLGSPGSDNYNSASWVVESGAILQYTATNVIQNSAVMTVNAGGSIVYGQESTGNLSGAGSASLTGGLLVLTAPSSVDFSGVYSGTGGLDLDGGSGGVQTLSGLNTYTGQTMIRASAITINTIKDVSGGASSLGAPTSAASGTIKMGASSTTGTLIYAGTGNTTDRVIDLSGTTGGATIDQSGSGLLKFTSDFTATGVGAKTLTLQGASSGTGELAGAIVNGSGTTSLVKAGAGTWTLSGINTFSGTTSVNGGSLLVNGTNASSAVTVNSGATLGGTGSVGSVNVLSGGILSPASSSAGTFSTGALSMASGATMNVNLGSSSDLVATTGDLALAGTVNVTEGAGFGPGTYVLFTFTGSLTSNTLAVGTVPAGYTGQIAVNGAQVNLVLTKSLVITGSFTANSKPFDGTAAATIATNGLSLSGVVGSDVVSLSPVLVFADAAVGATKSVSLTGSGLSGANAAKYTLSLVGAPTASADITGRAITLTANARNKTYGDVLAMGTTEFSLTSGTLVSGDAVTGVTLTSAGDVATANVGSYTITPSAATGTGLSNYVITYASGTLTVGTRAITVTADAQSKSFGASDPALTYQVTNGVLQNGDGFTGTLSRVAGSAVGSYAIQQNSLALSGNYALTYVGANLTIGGKALTIAANARSKTYGDVLALGTSEFTITSGTLESGDAVTGVTLTSAGDVATANVGNYTITPSAATGTGLSNYTITYAPGTLAVGTRAITVTADAQTKYFGAADPALTYQVTSGALQNGDAFTGSLARLAGSTVGTYAIQQNSLALSGNYALTFVGANLTITGKALTITANARSKTYGDALTLGTSEFTITSGTLESGDAVTGVSLTSAGDVGTANVGNYTITPSVATGTGLSNYTITYAPGTLTVGTRAITVTADAQSKVFGNSDPTLTYQVTSGALQNGDVFTGALSRAAGSALGSYAIQQNTLALSGNYVLTYVGANLLIASKGLTITANARSKTYGDVLTLGTSEFTITSGTLESGDAVTGVTLTCAGDVATANVGSHTITPSAATGTGLSNYTITYAPGTLTVGTRAITVTADAQTKSFGAADPALTYQVTSGALQNGDAFTGSLSRVAGTAVGSYAIQQNSLALSGNYALTYVGANLTIAGKAITITANARSKTYGDVLSLGTSEFSITSGSLESGDALTGVTLTSSGDVGTANVGSYTITPSAAMGTGLSNYTITYASGTLAVGTRAITVTADAQSKVFGNSDPTLTYQVTSGALQNGDVFTGALSRAAGSALGSYAIQQNTLALSGNYVLTYVGANLLIASKGLTITANARSKTYGDVLALGTSEFTITSGTLESGDAVTGVTLTSSGDVGAANAGSYVITPSAATGVGLSSYAITYVNGTLTVGTRAITVTADAQTKSFGAADPALTYQVTSGALQNGDAFTGSLSRAAGSAVGSYAIGQNSLALSGNYALTYVGANLTIGGKVLTITANARSKTYGDVLSLGTSEFAITSGTLESGDALTGVTLTSAGDVGTANVGSYTITPSAAIGTGLSNYTITYAPGTLTVGTRAITVTADAQTKSFGAADPALTYQVTTGALQNGDVFTGSLSRAAGTAVGSYAIQQNSLALSGNYALTYVGANLTIASKALTITANARSKTYGDVLALGTSEFTITSGTLESGDALTGVTLTCAGDVATANAGSYVITPSAAAGTGLSNYTITYAPGTLTVGTRAITVTADAQSKSFGAADPALTYQVTTGALQNGDAFTGTLSRVAGTAVGSYAIQQNSLALSGNYALTYVGENLTIGGKALTITANARSKTYGDVLTLGTTEFTITSGILESGDAVTGVTLTSAGDVGPANVGAYTITPSAAMGTGLSNYAITYASGTLTVGARAITVTADAQSKSFGSVDPTLTVQVTSGELKNSDTISGSATRIGGESVGLYSIERGTLRLDSNYTLSFVSSSLSITGRAISIKARSRTKTYGDTVILGPTEFDVTSGSLLDAGDLTGVALSSAGAVNTASPGVYRIIPSGATGPRASGYAITYLDGELTVVRRPNQAPSFIKGLDQDVVENSGLHVVPNWATSITKGHVLEVSQQVGFRVSVQHPELFASLPELASNGTLSYRLSTDRIGTSVVRVRLGDDGGILDGGQDSSAVDSFLVTIRSSVVRIALEQHMLRVRRGDSLGFGWAAYTSSGVRGDLDTSRIRWEYPKSVLRGIDGRLIASLVDSGWVRLSVDQFRDSAWLAVTVLDTHVTVPGTRLEVGSGIEVVVGSISAPTHVAAHVDSGVKLSGWSLGQTTVTVGATDSGKLSLSIPGAGLSVPAGRQLSDVEVLVRDESGSLTRVTGMQLLDGKLAIPASLHGRYLIGWDTLPPRVSVPTSIDSVITAGMARIEYSLEDNAPDALARVCWRAAGSSDVQCRDLGSGNVSRGVATIPSADIPYGAEIWIQAKDGGPAIETAHRDFVQKIDTLLGPALVGEDRYDLLSFPYLDSTRRPMQELERMFGKNDAKLWRAYRNVGDSFEEVKSTTTDASPTTAWWVRSRLSLRRPWVSDVMTTPASQSIRIVLKPGWNSVGSPYPFDVNWDVVMGASSPEARKNLNGPYRYDPVERSWSLPDTTRRLQAWKGFLVRNSSTEDVVLTFPNLAWKSTAARANSLPQGSRSGIVARQGGVDSALVWVGLDSAACVGLDSLDSPMPPFLSRKFYANLSSPDPRGRRVPYLVDVRPFADSGNRWNFTVRGVTPGKPLALIAPKLGWPAGLPAWIIDSKSGGVLDWTDTVDFAVGNETVRTFTLVLGGLRPQGRVPGAFAIRNMAGRIAWSLPSHVGRARVRIDLHDMAGRRLRTLVDEEQDPGEYSMAVSNQGLANVPMVVNFRAGGLREAILRFPVGN